MLDLLFPTCCAICGKPVLPKGLPVHRECIAKAEYVRQPFCMKCGRAIANEQDELCGTCRRTDFVFDMGRCTFNYRSSVGRAIKELKSVGTREFVDFFTLAAVKRHADFLKAVGNPVIVPVPLHRTKERVRGFNQSELLARGLSERTGFVVRGLLAKPVKTSDQKDLNKEERSRNLAHAFSYSDDGEPVPERVLLVDDVYTTGSTINACAAVLKKAGVGKVYFICLAAATSEEWE